MKAIPYKKTINLDIVKPISTFLRVQYSGKNLDNLVYALQGFQKHRDEIVTLLRDSATGPEKLLQAHEIWFSDLIFLEERFSFDQLPDSGAPVPITANSIPIHFQWTSAYDSKTLVAHSALHYEKCSILFNIGAAYANLAFSHDKETQDGLKLALKHSKKSAAIFSLLRTYCMPGTARLAPELSSTGVSMHYNLMTAQADCCIYEKGVVDKMGRSLLSKLAHQVALRYGSASKDATLLHQTISGIPESLCIWLQSQELAFLAAAHYQRIQHDIVKVTEISQGYGKILCHLKLVLQLCRQAEERSTKADVPVRLGRLVTMTEKMYREIDADNKVIYLEVVPPSSDIPPLELLPTPAEQPKPSLSELLPLQVDDEIQSLFKQLVPDPVMNASMEYQARAYSLISPHTETKDRIENDLKTFLETHKLTYILMDMGIEQFSIPPSFWSLFEEIKTSNTILFCKEALTEVDSTAEVCLQKINTLKKKLNDEESSSDNYFQTYGRAWTCRRSRDVNGNFYRSLGQYKDKLNIAIDTNKKLRLRFEAIGDCHDWLNLSRNEFEKKMNDISTSPYRPHAQKTATKVADDIGSINNKISDVSQIFDELKSQINQNASELQQELLKSWQTRRDLQPLIDQYVDKFFKELTSSSKIGDDTKQLLEKMEKLKAEVVKSRSELEIQDGSRTNILYNIENAVPELKGIQKDVSDGKSFFTTLESYLDTLEQQIEQFLLARKEESFECLKRIGITNQEQQQHYPSAGLCQQQPLGRGYQGYPQVLPSTMNAHIGSPAYDQRFRPAATYPTHVITGNQAGYYNTPQNSSVLPMMQPNSPPQYSPSYGAPSPYSTGTYYTNPQNRTYNPNTPQYPYQQRR